MPARTRRLPHDSLSHRASRNPSAGADRHSGRHGRPGSAGLSGEYRNGFNRSASRSA
jgi:hypothetical protein